MLVVRVYRIGVDCDASFYFYPGFPVSSLGMGACSHYTKLQATAESNRSTPAHPARVLL